MEASEFPYDSAVQYSLNKNDSSRNENYKMYSGAHDEETENCLQR